MSGDTLNDLALLIKSVARSGAVRQMAAGGDLATAPHSTERRHGRLIKANHFFNPAKNEGQKSSHD
jgi:hypothetical protein